VARKLKVNHSTYLKPINMLHKIKFLVVFFLILTGCQSAQIKKRNFYNALLEPKQGVLHGAGQDSIGFMEYMEAVETKNQPVIYMTYVGLLNKERLTNYGERLTIMLQHLPQDVIPQIGLSFVAGKDDGTGQDKAVAEGLYDENIQLLIEAFKKFNRPAFIRIGYEFEGHWNGYTPEYYKQTYIKIANAIKEAQLNVATVWCAAGGQLEHSQLMEYYPGDEWVDWWGIDIFSPHEMTIPTLFEFLADADKHKKPVMIGESTPRYVGVTDGEKSWELWFQPYFNLIYQNPQIKAFCYINWDWEYWSNKIGFQWHDWKDARIQLNEVVKEKYKEELKNKFFIHSQNK
jgi:hypothetical protein